MHHDTIFGGLWPGSKTMPLDLNHTSSYQARAATKGVRSVLKAPVTQLNQKVGSRALFRSQSQQLSSSTCDLSAMILRSLVAGRPFSQIPFICPPDPLVTKCICSCTECWSQMVCHVVVPMDLPCDWHSSSTEPASVVLSNKHWLWWLWVFFRSSSWPTKRHFSRILLLIWCHPHNPFFRGKGSSVRLSSPLFFQPRICNFPWVSAPHRFSFARGTETSVPYMAWRFATVGANRAIRRRKNLFS